MGFACQIERQDLICVGLFLGHHCGYLASVSQLVFLRKKGLAIWFGEGKEGI